MEYLPLAFIKEIPSDIYERTIENFNTLGFPMMDRDLFIQRMFEIQAGTLPETLDKKKFIKPISTYASVILPKLGFSERDIKYGGVNPITEVMDIVFAPILHLDWARNKQVYKPDKFFCEALTKTKELKLTREMLEHLPCRQFYLDLSLCDFFYPIEGAFVYVYIYGDVAYLFTTLIDGARSSWTHYFEGFFNDSDEFSIDLKTMESGAKDFSFSPNETELNNKDINLNRGTITFFALQMLAYLSSHEPDINENAVTKGTYRPPKNNVIKNKFKEVQIWDVGVRFGSTLREMQTKFDTRIEILTDEEENNMVKSRKSPIPHFRSAHWQRYWVGHGRETCVVKWIEPTFVMGDFAKDIVIHT